MKTILIDARNFDEVAPALIEKIRAQSFIGLDTETQDSNRHEGLNTYCGYREDGTKSPTSKLVFDMRRTIMTGFSVYPENDDVAYYVNLNHADIVNRVPWDKARTILDAKTDKAYWVIHNASFEITVFRSCYKFELDNYICTMQMAVSAFGPDEYKIEDFIAAGQGGIKALLPAILGESRHYDPDSRGELPNSLADLVYKVLAKESDAAHSYNGFVKEISFGYGLKPLVQRFFSYKMTTFHEVMAGRAHMGILTGEEVAEYGADDAYWALRLFRTLMEYMSKNCPQTISTFFEQENPMIRQYADIWVCGLKVNVDAIWSRRDEERANMAQILRDMKAVVKRMVPFDKDPNASLDDAWYAKGYVKYRKQIEDWAKTPDFTPGKDEHADYRQCQQVRGPVSNAWAAESGSPESTGPNFSHYMPMRTLIYDLARTKVLRLEGKIQSDGEARGKLKDRFQKEDAKDKIALIEAINKIAGVEQRMKLYLTPYTLLMDPETGRLYPTVSSMLASRRMASQFPNPMQLAKRGESTYVRGFFEADHDDHVIVSIDWSSIELVEIGEFSVDPEFIKAYGQIPHQDLHAGAAADILSVEVPGLTEQYFKDLRKFKNWNDYAEHFGQSMSNYNRLSTDLKGQDLAIEKAYKYWRTEVGKGANFNYWYSGFLSTIGERMGWSLDKTAAATDRYRARFSVAEQWRVDLIHEGQLNGFVTLPDGHRRVRFEATNRWMEYFLDKFRVQAHRDDDLARRYNAVIHYMARKIQGRANNQIVNSMIQGSCATIAKRSILRIVQAIKDAGWTDREARFMIPIHDELVFSVHRSIVPQFIAMARGIMIDHPDIFKYCKLDASPSVGLTFEPWSKKSPVGQIELFELPKEINIGDPDIRATDDQVNEVVNHLFEMKKAA